MATKQEVINAAPVLIVHIDDWTGLYVEDYLVYEHHHVGISELVDYAPNYRIGDIADVWVDDFKPVTRYLEAHGGFPDNKTELLDLVS